MLNKKNDRSQGLMENDQRLEHLQYYYETFRQEQGTKEEGS